MFDVETQGNYSETQQKPQFTEVAYPATLGTMLHAISQDFGHTFNENTVKSRWLPDRFNPAIDGLKLSPIRTESGRWTELGHRLLWEFIESCIIPVDKVSPDQWREQLIERYGKQPPSASDISQNYLREIQTKGHQDTSALAIQAKTVAGQKASNEALKAQLQEALRLQQAISMQSDDLFTEEEIAQIEADELQRIAREQAIRQRVRAQILGKPQRVDPSS